MPPTSEQLKRRQTIRNDIKVSQKNNVALQRQIMKDILAVQTHLEEEKEGSRLASSSSPISLEDLKRAEAVTQDTVSDLAAVQIPKRKAGGLPSLQSFGFNAAAMMGSQSAQFQKMEKLSQIDPADRTPEDLEELRKEVSRFSMIEKLRIAPEAVRSFIHCLRFKSYNFPGMNVVKEGDAGEIALIVTSGSIRVVRKRENSGFGGSETMGTLNPGDVAGDGPLVEEGIWKTGLIVASPVNIMYISKVDYDRCARPALRKYWDRIDSTLRGLIALEGCSEEEFQEMKKSMAIRRVDAGTVLCAEGLYVNEVMVICMGFAQVYKDTETTTIPRNILVLQNQAYAMRMRKWDNAVLVGEAWRGELIDPNAVFNRQTASMSVVAASVLDVIVLPWGEASRIFNGDARQKFLRLSPTFPSGADLQKRILDVAKWRTYSRNLVQSVLKESKFASRLIGPELPLSSACAYNSLPVIGKISPSPGMEIPFAKCVVQDPITKLDTLPLPFSPGYPLLKKAKVKGRGEQRSISASPTQMMQASMRVKSTKLDDRPSNLSFLAESR